MNTLADLGAALDGWMDEATKTLFYGKPRITLFSCLSTEPELMISRRTIFLAIDLSSFPSDTEAQLRELLGLEGEGEGDRSVSAVNAPRRWSVRPKT